MPETTRRAVVPAYLFLCLVLGGSAQGVWQNMSLQLIGLVLIAWAAMSSPCSAMPAAAKPVLYLALALIAVVVLQLIPLPPSFWAHGNRTAISDGFRLLGQPLPMLPISLAPADTLAALLCIIPPLAVFCAMTRLNAYHPGWVAAILLIGALAGIVLGAAQVAGSGAGSPWYLYPQTNFGSAVGFFANSNHMADLLLLTIPFVAAIAAAGRNREIQGYSALLALLAGLVLMIMIGLFLASSLAGYGLALPVVIASALILLERSSRWRTILIALTALALVGGLAALAMTSIDGTKVGSDAKTSVQSREDILKTTSTAIVDNMPFGSGLGSFLRVYRLYERPDRVTNEYVVHAHDDYAEVTLELGVAGIVLMVVFLGWWLSAVAGVWMTVGPGPFSRAASIATAVVLAHSLVDFPLRTAAISVCFAACCALLVDRRVVLRRESTDLWPTRHLHIR
ncbi:MAG: O-antigen ligase family protein [Sphingomicrobium sp.]